MTIIQNISALDNKKIKTSLAASFLLSLTLFFFGPIYLYYTNIQEMPFLFTNIWYYILAGSLIAGLSLTLFLWWLKGSYHIMASALVFALALLFWIQGNILVWDYGLLDGHEIIFKNYFWNGVIDSLVWISILMAAILYSKKLYNYITILCALLLIMQGAGLAATAYSAPEESEWKYLQHPPDQKEMYEFSTNENVIIIILDTFQSDIFQQIIDEDPEYRDMFDGFTYYRNNVGGFPTTYLSVMYILSGKLYDNSIPISQFLNDTSLNSSLPILLKENGFRADIKSQMGRINGRSEIYDVIDTDFSASHEDIPEIASLYQLTFFRFVPQAMKQYFIFKSINMKKANELPDMTVYHDFKSAVHVSAPERTFKIFHLTSPHPGTYLNEALEYDESSPYNSTAKASLKISHALLDSLKRNDIYDNSLIFVIGDHGTGSGRDLVSGGIPLMLVKSFNSTGPLKISDAPVTLGDIPKTIAEELRIGNNFTGSSIFSVNEIDSRVRTHYSYFWANEYWADDYLPPLREYKISGFSWNATSWEPTFIKHTSNGVEYVPPPRYGLGSIIYFGIGGNAEQYIEQFPMRGWSEPENGFRWTDGQTANFVFSLQKPENDLVLNLSLCPFLAGQLKSQRLSVSMNGHRLQDFLLKRDMPNLIIDIPRSYSNEEIQRITFDLPDAVSPEDLGVSVDPRKLGISVRTLSINYRQDKPHEDILESSSSSIALGSGFYDIENWSRIPTCWLQSKATLLINSDENRTATLSLEAVSFYRNRTLEMYFDEVPAAQVAVPMSFINVSVPVHLAKGANTMQFHVVEGCERPSDIKELNNTDSRCLSVAIQNLIVT